MNDGFTISARHRLQSRGQDVVYAPLPGDGAPMRTRRFLVMHFTAGWSAASSIEWWQNPAAKGAGAHIIIGRDGQVIQCRAFDRTAGHAGVSRWRDPGTGKLYLGLNSCSIGIELANRGDLPQGTTYPQSMGALAGTKVPVRQGTHKHGGPPRQWEVFPEPQMQAALRVAAALVDRYKLDDVIGHDDCAPDRKEDPGPAFPMTSFRHALGFTAPLPNLK